eukprot:347327-Chlamydomonas_euryale.AAC.1
MESVGVDVPSCRCSQCQRLPTGEHLHIMQKPCPSFVAAPSCATLHYATRTTSHHCADQSVRRPNPKGLFGGRQYAGGAAELPVATMGHVRRNGGWFRRLMT